MQSYRSRDLAGLHDLAGGTLAIHCSDPRYQPHFQDFLRTGLGLEHYSVVAVPGGAHTFTLTEHLPQFSWAAWQYVDFMTALTTPARVILIGHQDCRWYQQAQFEHLHGGSDHAQHADLQRVKSEIQRRLPGAAVETWFARLDADGVRATFEPEGSRPSGLDLPTPRKTD
jgi:hypothetical protein